MSHAHWTDPAFDATCVTCERDALKARVAELEAAADVVLPHKDALLAAAQAALKVETARVESVRKFGIDNTNAAVREGERLAGLLKVEREAHLATRQELSGALAEHAATKTLVAVAVEAGMSFLPTDDGERTRCSNVRALAAEEAHAATKLERDNTEASYCVTRDALNSERVAFRAAEARERDLRAALENIAERINSKSHREWAASREPGEACQCVSCTARAALAAPAGEVAKFHCDWCAAEFSCFNGSRSCVRASGR